MPQSYNKPVAILSLIWIIVSAIVTICGTPEFWGMMPSESISALWIVPATALCAIMLLGALSGKENFLAGTVWEPGKRNGQVLAVSATAIAVAAAWYLRSENHFLGDGWAMIGWVKPPFTLRVHEPLDSYIHQVIYRLLAIAGVEKGEYAFSIPHVALLPLYLVILWRISRRISAGTGLSLIVFILLLATGPLQLFAGYVESYTLVNLCLAGYMLAMLRHLDNPKAGFPWIPAVLLLLAAGCTSRQLCLSPRL